MSSSPNILTTQLASISESLQYFYPEICCSLFFVLLIVSDLLLQDNQKKYLWWIAIGGLAITACLTFLQIGIGSQILFNHSIEFSPQSLYIKFYFIASLVIMLVYLQLFPDSERKYTLRGEFYAFLFALLLGLNVMCMASNMILLYMAIELVSISCYILVSVENTKKSAEAGLKYLLFGAVTSALMLYGMSWYYGLTGTLNWSEIPIENNAIISIVLLLLSAGALFKLSLFPFHLWTPDVYEGAPAPVTALLSIAPKGAGVILFANILHHLYPSLLSEVTSFNWVLKGMVLLIAITITIGNWSALGQLSARRMLAYSSIAHAGFIMIGLLNPQIQITPIVYFYLTTYLLMNMAAFLMVDYLAKQIGNEDIASFKGLGLQYPYIGILFLILMISLVGLPPTLGFYGKLFIFSNLYESYLLTQDYWLMALLVFGLFNTVISLFYYLKIPYYLFFKTSEKEIVVDKKSRFYFYFSILVLPLILVFFMPDLLFNFINFISR